ncbi:hypothetical protein F0365_04015 [Nonlabens sp. Ci31]|jgi:hypothetical protein|uniref:hypothetical protein n=1 Tax=Nonlabens sp. Ci31 TaxID=2608253 RepID=UPI0014647C8A|nr:hypothetical protein [Nonlabens sp. Ci31]QJP33629.1 hypothetical protein F0365_04015 [Nonlabens sp. Ci31]
MDKKISYYRESGSYHAPSLFISVVFLIFLSLLLAYLYNAITIVMPIIYINVLLVFGLGIVLGYSILVLCKLSKVGNYKIRIGLALLIGILTLYFQWSAYLGYLINEGLPSLKSYIRTLGWIFYDSIEKEVIVELYHYGAYEVFNTQVTDYALLFIWFLEAAIIIAIPILAVFRYVPLPISDTYNKFYDQYTIEKDFRSLGSGELTAYRIHTGPAVALQELEGGKANRHSKIKIYYLPQESKQYLKAENISVQRRNESKTEVDVIIKYLELSTPHAKELLETFRHRKDGFQLL